MALQEKLEKFKQQQEKCQTIRTNIAAASGPPRTTTQKPAIVKTPSPSIKFSNDTERLQIIHGIRKGPVGSQIKRVIDLLYETRQSLTPDQINDACYVDVHANKAVFDSLKNNPKVHYDGVRFSYKSKHDLKDKSQLLDLIKKSAEGIGVVDLKDAYPTVMEDLQALKCASQIWLLSNFDSQEDVAYPNDQRIAISVHEDIKQLFRGVELPNDMLDVEKDLQKNGMKPATNTAKRRAAAEVHSFSSKQKAKKRKTDFNKRTKLTNVHLPELFRSINS